MSSHPQRIISLVLGIVTILAAPSVASGEIWLGDDAQGRDVPKGIEFFEKHVRPILVAHCYECHSGSERNGGLLLDSREATLAGGDSGQAILPGDTDQSRLIQAVRYDNHDLQMPPQRRLDDGDIRRLEQWVAMGAPDPRDGPVKAKAATGMSIEEGQRFWSLQPIVVPKVPETGSATWCQTPIDHFILAKLESRGISPAARAERRTLIRRLTYDLIGLPPTTSEIDDFTQDERPDAYRRLVERLLASEQYGVRWGRHWLDVARYADSNGLDENLAFGNAWRYRDYVVDSMNEDRPVDRFIVEQVAGDLIDRADEGTKTATGFLVLGAKVLAEPDREKLMMDTIDEQIDTMGKALLGLTLGCARCHDHKFDPIHQADYYALAAIFKSTKTFADSNTGAIKHWYEHLLADESEIAAIKKFDDQINEKNKVATDYKNQAVEALRQHARAHATEYLMAATQVNLEMTLADVARVAAAYDLHPRILHHCRRHLHFNTDDPVLAPWREFSGEDRIRKVEAFYRPLFTSALQPPVKVEKPKSGSPESASIEEDKFVVSARATLHNNSGLLAVPPKPEFAFDSETLAEYHRLLDDARLTESLAPDVTAAMGVVDGDIVNELPIHIRGSYRNLGAPIAKGIPVVFDRGSTKPSFPLNQSGRLQLAHWLTSPEQPLTARVFVNRIWRWHMGTGLVLSTENFGVLGEAPSHPELLDWLAVEFINSGWSTNTFID